MVFCSKNHDAVYFQHQSPDAAYFLIQNHGVVYFQMKIRDAACFLMSGVPIAWYALPSFVGSSCDQSRTICGKLELGVGV